jgi:hypothetical protein
MGTSSQRTPLSDVDRRIIGQARELAGLTGDDIRARAGTGDPSAYAYVMGEAQVVLGELAAIIERLGGTR